MALQPALSKGSEGRPHVEPPFPAVQRRLIPGGLDPLNPVGDHSDAQRPGQREGKALGLVELALPPTDRVERHRDDALDLPVGEIRQGRLDEETGEEGGEPGFPLVLEPVDGLQGEAFGMDGRAGPIPGGGNSRQSAQVPGAPVTDPEKGSPQRGQIGPEIRRTRSRHVSQT